MLILGVGVALGWSSPAIPKLLADDTPIVITPDEGSWIVALLEIGNIIGATPAAYLMDRYLIPITLDDETFIIFRFFILRLGRKLALTIGVIPISIAWILIGTVSWVPLIYVARMLCGFSFAFCYTIIPMYMGEIASDKIRGALTISLTIMVKTGILLVYIVGRFTSYRMLAWFGFVPLIIFLAFVYFLPETPYYLLSKNREKEAFDVLVKLRGHTDIDNELEKMSIAVEKAKDNNGTFKELFLTRSSRTAMFLLLGLSTIQILCGSQAIIAYSETIFQTIGTTLLPSDIAIIFGVVQLASAVIAASIVDRVGRRPLLLISISGTASCNFIVALYFFLERLEVNTDSIQWLPVMAVMIFILCYVIGLATVLFAVIGEIFPSNLKAIAGALYTISSSVLSFGVSKLFQVVSDGLGSDVSFGFFALSGIIVFPFVWYWLPETKGKPLSSILEELSKKKK